MLKRNHGTQNPIEYKWLQGHLMKKRMIKNAKKDLWRNVCNSVGRQTKINQEWSVIWSEEKNRHWLRMKNY